MDRFDAMRAFVQVVDSGNYTRAAVQLTLHTATVSQQVQQLEARLGARLLIRTTRSVKPTEEGMAHYRHARAILQPVDEAESALRHGTRAPDGHRRIDVPVAMGRLVFAPELGRFLESYPGITVELGCTDRSVDLVRVLPAWDCPTRPLNLVTPGGRTRPARARVFMDWAQALLRRRLGLQRDARRRPVTTRGANALSVPAPASTHPPARARSPPRPRA